MTALVLTLAASLWLLPAQAAGCDSSIGQPHAPGGELEKTDGYMAVTLRGSLRLKNAACKSLPLMGLSGLAWSADTGMLYALSDRANIFHLQPVFSRGRLTDVTLIDAYPLRDSHDQPLGVENGDSEGLTIVNGANGIRGDEALLVSFERQPRISRYRPYGLLLHNEPIAPVLADIQNYNTPNSALESVVMHPDDGLLTAPQLPLKANTGNHFRIYNNSGVIARFERADTSHGTLTDIALTPEGDLLALERIFSGIFGITAAVIHRLGIHAATSTARTVVRFDRDDGHAIDNFEGLTHHTDNRYFMVSDDNGFALQQTLLFYFEVHSDKD